MTRRLFGFLLLFVVGALMIALARPVSDLFLVRPDPMDEATAFAEVLDAKTSVALRQIKEFRNEISRVGPKATMLRHRADFTELYQKHGILVSVFRNDELVLWTGSVVSPVSMKRTAALGTEIARFDNGWYRLLYLTDGVDEYIAAIAIKKNYPYDNLYLDNGFAGDFARPGLVEISTRSQPGAVKLKADHQYFYLVFNTETRPTIRAAVVFLLFTWGGGILILIGLLGTAMQCAARYPPWAVFSILAVLLAAGRYWSLQSGWPGFIAGYGLFDPSVYASSALFPSMADLIINTVLVSATVFAFRRLLPAHSEKTRTRKGGGVWVFVGVTVILFAFGTWINHIVKGLIVDSTIPLDINNITGMNTFSFLGVAVAGVWYFSYFLLADSLARSKFTTSMSSGVMVLLLLLLTALQIVVNEILGLADMIMVLWPPVILFAAIYLRNYLAIRRFRLAHGTLVIVLFGFIAAHMFLKYSRASEHSERRIIAQKLAQDDDPVAELLYSETMERLLRDAQIKELFKQNDLHTRETFQDYVLSRYFTGYWSKFDISFIPFLGDGSTWGKLSSVRPPSLREFRDKIETYGHVSYMDSTLHHIHNSGDNTAYIALVPVHYSLAARPDGYYVVELKTKPFRHQIGFPALLMDRSTAQTDHLADYSSARYLNGKLIDHRGDFPYFGVSGVFDRFEKDRGFLPFLGYEHYISKTGPQTMVVVSKPLISPLDKATTFSYLCIIFGVLFVAGMGVRELTKNHGRFPINLNQKIQILLVVLISVTMVLFTVATRYYIEQKYTEKNEHLLSEKMQSILTELKNKLGEEEELNYDMVDYINRNLSQFSYIFFTDINIYTPEGNLIASSQQRMFNQGIISRRMDPRAYVHVDLLKQVEYISNESIGKMEYLSVYTPFYNDRGDLLAYVNLPYFARQTELENEISNFMVAVINLFVLVFLFAILLGLFISQWITLPLRAIRKSLSAIELGKSNRVVGYSARDEIGLLVNEYNAKVSELEHNAEKLARSERESAWREMAKQVAHEIKNPLTPMKLSVQHMMRSVETSGDVDPEKLKKLSDNLIAQIDALSSIAGAFSNFARMPKARAQKFDLAEVLRSTLALFQGFDRTDLVLETTQDEAWVLADKDQMARVFNNLIKNAIQAVPDSRRGKVTVRLERRDDWYVCSVSDNGIGISDENRGKMFVPSFTTKTRGMGLGLAISKNIVEQAGGRIDYTSEEGIGSTFFVWLPVLREE